MELDTTLDMQTILSSVNLADDLSDDDLDRIGKQVRAHFDEDQRSRGEWEKRMEESFKLVMQLREEKSWPWPNASNVKFPLIGISSLQFHARAYPELVTGELVRFRSFGGDPDESKRKSASRIATHIRYQTMEESDQWQDDTDTMLISLPIMGAEFKKTYFCPVRATTVSEWVSGWELVLPYRAKNIETCRKTHVLPMTPREIREHELNGLFLELDDLTPTQNRALNVHQDHADERKGLSPTGADETTPRDQLEQHTYLDLDGDGYEEPYVITVDFETSKVRRIFRRFDREDIITEKSREVQRIALAATRGMAMAANTGDENAMAAVQSDVARLADELEEKRDTAKIIRITPTEHFTRYLFLPSPDGGVYGFGFGALLSPINESVNTLINQLIDSGTLQNRQCGFLGRGAKIKAGKLFFQPGEWRVVQAAGTDLKNNIVPLPVNQPSAVLFNLLGLLIQYGERLASTTDLMAGETPGQNTPASTSQAALEQGMKVFTSIFKRLYRGLTTELRKFYIFNRRNIAHMDYIGLLDLDPRQLVKDYKGDPRDIVPAADPSLLTDREKLARMALVAERSVQVPGYNRPEIERRLLDSAHVEDIDRLYPLNEDGSLALPPAPDPEIEIKKAEEMRRTVESRDRAQVQMMDSLANVALTEAKIKQMAAEAKTSDLETLIKVMAERREGIQMMLEAIENERKSEEGGSDSGD